MHAEDTREWKICSVSVQRYVQSLLNAWQSNRRDATLTIQHILNQGKQLINRNMTYAVVVKI